MSDPRDRPRADEEETQLLRRALHSDAARESEQELGRQAVLVVFGVNGDLLELVVVPAAGLRIGRAPDQDVVLEDRTVSRRHARLEVVDGRFFLDDAGSLNDTLLNGELVQGRAELFDGARINVGLHLLRLSIR
ncbi:MAG: FHA domain-containing protein [Fimbriimonadaceae bacterium]|nr:FHA domain-containing protein [Fimbriimonadaceae bacterium]